MSVKSSRKNLIVIFAWFFIPLFFAFIWYKLLPEGYRPNNTTNNGDILESIFTLDDFSHQDVSGIRFSNVDVEKVWTLLQFVNGSCDEACSRSLYDTRQLRVALGKDIKRLNRVVILDADTPADINQKMWASHPDLRVLIGSDNGMEKQVRRQVKELEIGENSLFLVDPLGNVMMHFSSKLTPKEIKSDIRKLFKLSQID
ncbi:MAG: SCO family protein [Granulosicoccus sp.]